MQPEQQATDLIVATRNPAHLDRTVRQLGPAVVVAGSWDGEKCRVRVFGPPGFMQFAITNQGYGEVLGEEPVAATEEDSDAN